MVDGWQVHPTSSGYHILNGYQFVTVIERSGNILISEWKKNNGVKADGAQNGRDSATKTHLTLPCQPSCTPTHYFHTLLPATLFGAPPEGTMSTATAAPLGSGPKPLLQAQSTAQRLPTQANQQQQPQSGLRYPSNRKTIYDRNLNRTRTAELSRASFGYLFAEMVTYAQRRVTGIQDLERRYVYSSQNSASKRLRAHTHTHTPNGLLAHSLSHHYHCAPRTKIFTN